MKYVQTVRNTSTARLPVRAPSPEAARRPISILGMCYKKYCLPFVLSQVWYEMAKGDFLAFHGGHPFSSAEDFRFHLKNKANNGLPCRDSVVV